MVKKTIFLKEEETYITLQSLLKLSGVIQTGGMVKFYLSENPVLVNGEKEDRRGRKLYPGDLVEVEGSVFLIKNRDS